MTFRLRLASEREVIKQKYLTTERSKGMILNCRDPISGIAGGNPSAMRCMSEDRCKIKI
ncbi:MAG: hypothetical protein GX431_08410 [Bacteroidales bacterium]|nr:hypothetical protein [Bacteroidales bacterium]